MLTRRSLLRAVAAGLVASGLDWLAADERSARAIRARLDPNLQRLRIKPMTEETGQRYIVHPGARIVACKSCGKPCVWGRTEKGKACLLSLVTLAEHPEKPGVWGAESHFRDCPDAAKHSRRGH